MTKWTKELKEECVQINIDEAKDVIRASKSVNKGQYVHNINSNVYKMENLLKKKLKFGTDDFKELCSLKLKVAGWMFLNK